MPELTAYDRDIVICLIGGERVEMPRWNCIDKGGKVIEIANRSAKPRKKTAAKPKAKAKTKAPMVKSKARKASTRKR